MRSRIRRGKRTALEKYTERCLNALDLTDMPPCIYVPYGMRKEVRVNHAGEVTKDAPTDDENALRVARADPMGLLIAMMQGQPIPVYRVKKDEKKFVITTDIEVPDLTLRASIAEELARRARKPVKMPTDYDAMIQRMAEGEGDVKSDD